MGKEFEYVFDVAGATSGEVRQELVNDDARNKVVYLHRRADDGMPMYLGIGSIERAYNFYNRNDYWKNVYAKHGCTVEILYSGLTWSEACEIEIRLIAEYREKYPDSMTNISAGGETGSGLSGEDAGNFKGHILFLSLCGKYYYICGGRVELEKSGFHQGNVYDLINGSNNRTYVTSKKIYVNGVKIKFKSIRFNSVDDITDEMLVNRVESVVSNDEIVGNCWEFHPKYKGLALGVSESHFILLGDHKDMKSKKFHDSNISACILGNRSTHRGFRWFRVDEKISRESLLTLKNLIPYDEDSAERLEELLTE